MSSGMSLLNTCCTLSKDHVLSNKHRRRNVRLEDHHPFVRWKLRSVQFDGDYYDDGGFDAVAVAVAVAHVGECVDALYGEVDVSEYGDGNVRDCNDAYDDAPVDTFVLQ